MPDIYELQLFDKKLKIYVPQDSGELRPMQVRFADTRHPSKRLVLVSKNRPLKPVFRSRRVRK
jgi:hypothetical protein